MNRYLSFSFVFSIIFQTLMLQATLPAGLVPKPSLPEQSGLHAPGLLGQNKMARWGTWASLGVASLTASYQMYATSEQFFNALLQRISFLSLNHKDTAHAMSLFLTIPISAVALMKAGPLAWYFFYILYAGERMSPLLARDALRDVQVYVQHLHVIKAIQQDLFEIIEQINQTATIGVSAENVQFSPEIPENLHKNIAVPSVIDPAILINLQQAIEQDEEYVHTILTQLQFFLTAQELAEFEQALQVKSATVVYAIAYELQDQAQAIIDVLKISQGQNMGDDARILNYLIKDLVAYWQSYTQSLARGIDASVRFCNNVHLIEQGIVTWFDRSLLCV